MMFIIGILLFLLGFAMAVAGFIGIFAPKLLKDRKTGEIHTRGTWAGAMVLGLVMFFGGDSLLMGDDDKAKQTEADTKAETLQAADSASNPTSEKGYDLTINTPKKELPISFEELRKRINSQMALFDYPKTNPIPKNAQPTGEKDSVNLVYQHTASEGLSMIISASPENKKPRGLILAAPTSEGNGAELLGLFGKACAILAAPIADDSAKSKELTAKLLKMGVKLAEDFNKNPEEQAKDSYTEDGITYSIAITPGLPVMFSLSLEE